MNNIPFAQEKSIEQKLSPVDVTNRERNLIKLLRKQSFGKIVIHIANQMIVRAEIQESILINDE